MVNGDLFDNRLLISTEDSSFLLLHMHAAISGMLQGLKIWGASYTGGPKISGGGG